MELINTLYNSIKEHSSNTAFCINEQYYTYKEFNHLVNQIRSEIIQKIGVDEKIIGLFAHDDIYTYASIIALWLENKGYVALNPLFPDDRNIEILEIVGCETLLNSNNQTFTVEKLKLINTSKITNKIQDLKPKPNDKNGVAYMIFTSGSTGKPKGVPITFNNIEAFAKELHHDNYFSINEKDKCLQMFELTFDMSVVSYLLPLLYGASVYTIPKGKIKYMQVFSLLEKHKLTVLITVPSIINYLKPYFAEINAPQVKVSCFAGGKLFDDIANEWNKCIPNAQIINYYGPTETTIYCGYYLYTPPSKRKNKNNIISIGKTFKNTDYLVIDENNNAVPDGITGELAIAGAQVTPGYWNNSSKNQKSFFIKKVDGEPKRYYKSGDLCYKDEDGDYMYVGRNDFQVKIQGYRIELGEIEYHVKKTIPNKNFVVLDIENSTGNKELYLILESDKFDVLPTIKYLKEKLPHYMIPTQIRFINIIPHNINGKIDRHELRNQLNHEK
ncbi:AMP-binding protein [Hyunsoonleella pacifica]|uniref:AMP-dependent synthetase n=1 Tax=Hyunsoonleella pacifica TaxID=1080224 RepID=A0A4Q9FS14_9FLAO|nr:AMP-binding protein [Hyunsoonleella pacifica]TBN17656.1 AMP-dependent synthetase [Hyunsoonleella pacifica]GGD10093.1 peptide synthetase [Hyunsoonleella pacifica]